MPIASEVLGKLLVSLHTLDIFPDAERMAEFLQPAMREIPGIVDSAVCLHGRIMPAGRGDIATLDLHCAKPDGLSASAPLCSLKDRPDIRLVPIRTPRQGFGCLLLVLGDEAQFRPYEPFLFNIGSMVATILENRGNARSLAEVNAQLNRLVDELEDHVKDRTKELEATNESLQQHEIALERANRALSTLSTCNQALMRAANETELLNSICRLIVETGGYRMAWVGFPEHDAEKSIRPMAQFGVEEGYLAAGRFSWADNEFGRGPGGTALRTGAVQVIQNILVNQAFAPWREEALKRDYQSSIVLPLKGSSGTLGILSIYAPDPDAFNEAEVELLRELAGDLAFGIETLRMRIKNEFNTSELLRHEKVFRQSLEDSIKTIANTVEMRDPYTAGHQQRVSKLATAISRDLGLPEETILGIGLAANIHDLGKISIPAEILLKPERLTAIEFMLVKTHSQSGYDALKDIQFPWPIAKMVWQHHERLDGSGYPQGLKGDQILFESRILAVADVVDAMTSHRPYRAALEIDIALDEIQRGRGIAYDPAVVDTCLKLFPENRFPFPG